MENFLKLVDQKFYDGLLFHRVIKDFMIQTGDSNSKQAKPGERLGFGDLGYTIPQEFRKEYYHKKGAIAAARQGDAINPMKESSASQFYIVHGTVFTKEQLDIFAHKRKLPFTEKQIKDYTTIGGAPHLDYEYTVFGHVIEGLEVIDKIANYETDSSSRPKKDIKIITITPISK
jgi:peptidyl-prolyl cis-trans isomerase B (cyclophilin B)